ncbi:radical SAM family heme chaperone HemW [Oleiagrimonas sp. C23AA]|uniref:radical SAM family heme chaperone HemW n=1 Tax=Oleiagrimonas sp. C23AA TaxID=2719047 RepID=UPI001423CAB7|nr:radical SAM family heme chaperone HemW [Oleiagrimonas sp. C23AA]NII09788.1 radical SAM family heme chaperone HemW [Oleiagrimonas sp. C23AA]
MTRLVPPPLSLYVHIPWCVRKCPYCDFNSHATRGGESHIDYTRTLLADLDGDMADFADAIAGRALTSIFFGGGTPSLFAPALIGRILDGVAARLPLASDVEITLETNPGTVEHGRFADYLVAGVNRLSFGVQSFDDAKLRRLGRIHSAAEAESAIQLARRAGFDNFNIDLMYALPEQDLVGALADVERALALEPAHISHYQLTLEPNTLFAAKPPPLPDDDDAWSMQEACQARLAEAGFAQYEVSAYARDGRRSRHNLNYWTFGDYLAIGAGAHGKITAADGIRRRWKTRHPRAYQEAADHAARIGGDQPVPESERGFEYMLNALRLIEGTPLADFSPRTGLHLSAIEAPRREAIDRGWLLDDAHRLRTTDEGQRLLNDVTALFLN